MIPARFRKPKDKYGAVEALLEADRSAGDIPAQNAASLPEMKNGQQHSPSPLSVNDLKWKAGQAQKEAAQYGGAYLNQAIRAGQQAEAEKGLYASWDAVRQKVNTLGVHSLSQQERRIWDPLNRLYPTDAQKQGLIQSLLGTLDGKLEDSGRMIRTAQALQQSAASAKQDYANALQQAGGGSPGSFGAESSSLPPNPEDDSRTSGEIPRSWAADQIAKASAQTEFHSMLEGLTPSQARQLLIDQGMALEFAAGIKTDQDVQNLMKIEKDAWLTKNLKPDTDLSGMDFSVGDQTVLNWIADQYKQAAESGDETYIRRLTRLHSEFYQEAKKRLSSGQYDKYNDGLFSYHEWTRENGSTEPGFVVEYLHDDRLWKNGGKPTPDQEVLAALMNLGTAAILGIPQAAQLTGDIVQNAAYVYAINAYREYNPGFILKEGDLMVYDDSVGTSYYRGNEWLYTKFPDGSIRFSPRYNDFIPDQAMRGNEAVENLIKSDILVQ